MRVAVLLALALTACQYHTDCDETMRDLYPDSDIQTFNLRDHTVFYRVDQELFVECYYGGATLSITARKPRSWAEAYCDNYSPSKQCMEKYRRKENGTRDTRSP